MVTENSDEAFRTTKAELFQHQIAMVIAAVKAAGLTGLTCDEYDSMTPKLTRSSTASSRFTSAVDKRMIFPSGVKRKTGNGKRATVYKHVDLLDTKSYYIMFGRLRGDSR